MTIVLPDARPDYWEEASAQLMRRDRILKKLIPQHQDQCLQAPSPAFMTLARAIIGQQVSTKAADTVWQRFTEKCGRRPTPASVAALELDDLRALGLSKRKSEYIADLAVHFDQKKVKPAAWSAMDDEAVIADLCAIRGIGRWTVEMLLIYTLERADILPADDFGVRDGYRRLKGLSDAPKPRAMSDLGAAWSPHRTAAAWYLWRVPKG